MMKIAFKKFVEYHKNPNKSYSIKELEEIRASEFAMHLLCPTMFVLEEFLAANLDFENFDTLTNYERYDFYEMLRKRFVVPMDIITIKIDELCCKYRNTNTKIEDIILNDFFYLYDKKNIMSISNGLTICFPKAHDKLEKYIKEKYNVKSYTKIKKCKVLFDKKMNS